MIWIGLLVFAGLVVAGLALGLLPTNDVRSQLGTLLAADATTLAPASNANKIALINAPFTPSGNLNISMLSFATFVGSTPLAGATGAQGVGVDPATGQQIITILTPAGGWRWTCTTAPGSPETIYGFALTDHAAATLLGTQLLTTPEVIQAVGDQIDLGAVDMTLVAQPIS